MKLNTKIFLPIILISALLILLSGCFGVPADEQPGLTSPTYTVTYDGNGKDVTGEVPVDTTLYPKGGEVKVLGNTGPKLLVRDGYTFDGWHTDANAASSVIAVVLLLEGDKFVMVEADVTFYAIWGLSEESPAATGEGEDTGDGYVPITPTHTVTFDENGGDTEAVPTTKTVIQGGNVGTLPAEPTLTGHIFTSWNTEADGSGTEFTATTVVTADIPVYAQWEECATVTLAANWSHEYRDCEDEFLYWWNDCGAGSPDRDRLPIIVTIVEGSKSLDNGTITINIDTEKLAVQTGPTPDGSGNIVLTINSSGTGVVEDLIVEKAGELWVGVDLPRDWTDTTDITVVELQDAELEPVCLTDGDTLTIEGDDNPIDPIDPE